MFNLVIKLQPPSGGCVLKQHQLASVISRNAAATFGWLCVETSDIDLASQSRQAATFGWLCVETIFQGLVSLLYGSQPPSGGCVLKL